MRKQDRVGHDDDRFMGIDRKVHLAPLGLRVGTLLLLPLAFLATGVYVRSASGPFWLGPNFDPDYVYLLSGLRLVLGLPSWHVEHPGTPIQVLIAALIRLDGRGGSVLSSDVLFHPEHYLNVTGLVLTFLVSGALFFTGLTALRFSNSVAVALLVQSGPFLSGRLLARDTYRVNPEPALILASLLLLAVLFRDGTRETVNGERSALMAGLVIGFGVACKFTFAPLLLIPVICLPGWRAKGLSVMAAAVAFVIATLPIVRLYPIAYAWIIGVITHRGAYGSGEPGFVRGATALIGARAVLGAAPVLMVGVCSGLAILISRLLRRKRGIGQRGELAGVRMIMGLVAAGFAEALLVLKQPEPRYMIAGVSLGGALLGLSWNIIKQTRVSQKGWLRAAMAAGLVVLMVDQYRSFAAEIAGVRAWGEEAARVDAMTKETGCAVVYYYRASSPAFALSFGTIWGAAGDLRKSLERMFPGYYEIWQGPADWRGPVKWSDLFEHNRCVALRGSQDPRALKLGGGLAVEPIMVGAESLYIVRQVE